MRSPNERKRSMPALGFKATDLAIALAAFIATSAHAQSTEADGSSAESDAAVLTDIVVSEDPLASIANETTGSSIGFAKPILDTPRSVSFVSSEQIQLLGISSVDDLTRVVPGTFTTTRYGLQGGINVRGVAADMYFRGMKRINMQGHARTSLAAMDSIEVIKGPPSPIFGMGKIGGYSNLTPKSGRAKIGTYLEQAQGFAQVVGGDYMKSEISAGAGGPISIGSKTGGYYVYGLLEDSDSYVKKVGVTQRIIQATSTLDNFIGPFRLEVGTQAQNSITSGAYMNRVTQRLLDDGVYISGQPLINLDRNGDGAIGFRETHEMSPIKGNVSGSNRPLNQTFAWPMCNGVPCQPDEFPKIAGIPQTMYDYLVANPTLDPTGLLRQQGPGGPVPTSGQLPIGFVLDPRTVQQVKVDQRRNGAFETEQNARLAVIYADLVYDADPDFQLKNQFFHDFLDSFKNSYLPYGEKQDIHLWEDKITATYRIPDEKLPEWLRINTLASVNYRETFGKITSSGGDFDYRQDVMFNNGNHYPNTIFWNWLDNPSYDTGAPTTTVRDSTFSEMGVGTMFDIDFFTNTNLVLGARWDNSKAEANDYDRFNENASNAVNGGAYLPQRTTRSWDDGTSWSVSLSQKLPGGIRPYITKALSSVALDGANNIIVYETVNAPGGHIGEAELLEYGVKGSWFQDTLFFTLSHFKQTRTDISSAADPTASAEVSSTETKGIETELKWSPVPNASIQAYALFAEAKYIVPQSGAYEFNGRDLGFQDVVDSAGNVIYPAEAFLYGGRVQMTIPSVILEQYNARNGSPETQLGLNMNYRFRNGIGVLLGGNWFSSTYADRLEMLKVPATTTVNGAVTYDTGKWHLKVNGYNITDERIFRARNSDTGTNLISVMPRVRYEFTVKLDF